MKHRTATFNRYSIGVLECLYITPHIKINENMGHKHCLQLRFLSRRKRVSPRHFFTARQRRAKSKKQGISRTFGE